MNWTNERIDDEVRAIGVPLSCDLQIIGLMRLMRDEYEMKIAESQLRWNEERAALKQALEQCQGTIGAAYEFGNR